MNVHTNWSAKDYLNEYYLTEEVAEDERYVFTYLIKFLLEQNKFFTSVLDFGCGPTIHHIIPIAKFTEKIFLSDFLQQNLDEIQKWINRDQNAHNWDVYLRGVLDIEMQLELEKKIKDKTEVLNSREQLIRERIIDLLVGDVLKANPIALHKKQFELVTSFYCAEVATHIKNEWFDAMRHLLSLVKKNGWFLTAAIQNTEGYKIGNRTYPATKINSQDMKKVLTNNGFIDIDVRTVPIKMWTSQGFSGILLARGRKKNNDL